MKLWLYLLSAALASFAFYVFPLIPGVLVGSQVTVKLPDRMLRVGLATVLTLSGVKLLDAPAILLPLSLAGGVALIAFVARRPRLAADTAS